MRSDRTARIVLFTILFLFFLQALSDFIQSIYSFGLLVTAFTPQLAAVLLLFSPLVLIFVRRAPSRPWTIGLAAVAVIGRLLEPLLDPGGRLVASGVSVGAFMLLFPLILAAGSLEPGEGWSATWGLLLAVILSIFLRTAGSSLDISEVGITQVLAWVLAALAGRLIWTLRSPENRNQSPEPDEREESSEFPGQPAESGSHEERRAESLRSLAAGPRVTEAQRAKAADGTRLADRAQPPHHSSSTGRVIGLCIGLESIIVVLYFAFVSPTVMARWTGYSYISILIVLVAVLWLFSYISMRFRLPFELSRPVVATWNVLFVLMLVLTIVPHQVGFPAGEDAFPLDPSPASPLWQIPLYLTLLLSPVIFVDFMFYVRQITGDAPSIRQLGIGFSVAALTLLVMVFLHVFTTIYDYARPIGQLFRDRFWVVYLIAGLGLSLPLLLAHPERSAWSGGNPRPRLIPWLAGTLAILTGAELILAAPLAPTRPSAGMLRVMTYNIQQGFDKAGNEGLPDQLAAIQHVQPDILGLEESDTARIANGNVDAVRYFADSLGMYSYYGPPTTVGTFGVALLSKYLIQGARTFYLYSTGEQTACIEAVIVANGKTYNVFVTHLGNGGPMVQLVDVLNRVDGLPNVILMGDFNFEPSTAQYSLATQTLADAWLLRWPDGRQLSGPGAEGRIDQMFVSPDIQVAEAEYVPAPSSDHPYLYAVMQ